MKKIVVCAIVALLFLLSINPGSVYALPAGTWASGIKIQNLDSTADASLIVSLYSETGVLAATLTTTANGDPLVAPIGGSIEL